MSNNTSGRVVTADFWYKLFSILFLLFFSIFIFFVSQCSLKIFDFSAWPNNLLCLGYAVLILVSFVAGILVALVGLEHAKKVNVSRGFYVLVIILYLVGLTVLIIHKF